jgi:four helix bundle protein
MKLEDLTIYQSAIKLGEEIWEIVSDWSDYEKKTIGMQIVRASDSIAANISEGFGRYHFKEIKQFGYYARGSLFETRTWLWKAYRRKKIDKRKYEELVRILDDLGIRLNNYIKSQGGRTGNDVKEDPFHPNYVNRQD